MVRGALGVVAAGVITVFAALLIRGQYIKEGPVVLVLSESRGWGIHRGDILIAGGWLIGVIAILALLIDRRPGDPG